MSRLLKAMTTVGAEYLTPGDTYKINTVNGGKYDQIYFNKVDPITHEEVGSGTFMRERTFKQALKDGSLIFVD